MHLSITLLLLVVIFIIIIICAYLFLVFGLTLFYISVALEYKNIEFITKLERLLTQAVSELDWQIFLDWGEQLFPSGWLQLNFGTPMTAFLQSSG